MHPATSRQSVSFPLLHVGSLHPELVEEDSRMQQEVVHEFMQNDAEKLLQSFTQEYQKLTENVGLRPHVLVIGAKGSGKSSIINSIFGSEITKTEDKTEEKIKKYNPEQQPIVLFDTLGLEPTTDTKEFFSETLRFLDQENNQVFGKNNSTGLEKYLHVVWYVLSADTEETKLFQELRNEKICQEIFGNLPILFIINKCDKTTPEQINSLREDVKRLELSNCIDIVQSITENFEEIQPPESCSSCGNSDSLIVIKRTNMSVCQACGEQTPFTNPGGVSTVLQATFDFLPSIAKEAFVAAQHSSFQLKDQRAMRIIREFYEEQTITYTAQGLFQILSKMLTRLSLVWEFRDHCHLLAGQLAKEIMNSFSFQEKLFLFTHQNQIQRNRATAIGILWNRAVRKLAKVVLVEATAGIGTLKENENWREVLQDSFRELMDENLDAIEENIATIGFEATLQKEFNAAENTRTSSMSLPSVLNYSSARDIWNTINTPPRPESSDDDEPVLKEDMIETIIQEDENFENSEDSDSTTSNKNTMVSSCAISIVKEGMLTKQGHVVRNWKRRFCVLSTCALAYFRSNKDIEAAGILELKYCRFIRLSSNMKNCFEMGFGKKLFFFQADSKEECSEWILAIQRQIQGNKQMEGFLIKQGAVVKSWKRRYFVLLSDELDYYVSKCDGTPIYTINLKGATVTAEEPFNSLCDKNCSFSISTTFRKYSLIAPNPEAAVEWIHKLTVASK